MKKKKTRSNQFLLQWTGNFLVSYYGGVGGCVVYSEIECIDLL